MLTVRRHDKAEFYPIYSAWCGAHGLQPTIADVLPENVFVCYYDDIPVYCSWVYFTDSKLLWIGFTVSNKTISRTKKDGAMEFLYSEILTYAKKKKIRVVFTTSATPSISASLEQTGFVKGDADTQHYYLNTQ